MSMQESAEEYPQRGIWTRMKERVFGYEDAEVEGAETPLTNARHRASIRLESASGQRVAIRLNASVFNDARIAADGLKGGEQQIVNLEKASPQMAERIIDFLSGVTYALDGSVDRVGEKVYLFAPANVAVELDGGSEPHSEL